MIIKVSKPTEQDIARFKGYPTWSAEPSTFDWFYDEPEVCYLLEGEVRVTTEGGEAVEFGAGDMVSFPSGLACTWEVRQPVRKHYTLG